MGSVMDQERPWEREEHPEAETMRERIKDRYRRSGGRLEPVMNQVIAELERIEALVTTPPPEKNLSLTIAALQRAHVERQEEWCPDQKPDLSFRGNELGGECGEAQNVIKKLERERHGWRGSRDTVEHLAEELADVIHCAVLVAITAGIEIEPAVVAKFNSTSEKNGLSTVLATTEGSADA